jgi:hypothetical protein
VKAATSTSPNAAINEALRRLVETERAKRRAAGEALHRMVEKAIRLKLTVLHEDADFETVARFVPELKQHRIGAGTDPATAAR